VSNWERGTVPRDEAIVQAIDQYCALLGDDSAADGSIPLGDLDAENGGAFDDIVANLTGARPLSDRQSLFVEAMIERLRSGPPLSEEDGRARDHLAMVLGLSEQATS
jgi:hypothetical protein